MTVCCGERSLLGQIISVDSCHHSDNPSHINVVVNPYLPWLSEEIMVFVVVHCVHVQLHLLLFRGRSELVQSILIASVPVENITGIAFLFLWEELENVLYHVQGMSTAFVARYKCCSTSHKVVLLDRNTFHFFPDLDQNYRTLWSDYYARTIFFPLIIYDRNHGGFFADMEKNGFVSEASFKVNVSQCLYKLPVHVSSKGWGTLS